MAKTSDYIMTPAGYMRLSDGSGFYGFDDAGNPFLIGAGGGSGDGGSSSISEDLAAIFGDPSDPLWNGLTQDAKLISILKAMHEQNEALKRIGNETNTLLVQVAEHTRHLVPQAI